MNESRAGGELLKDGIAPTLEDPIETLEEGTAESDQELTDDGWATVYTTPATQNLRQVASLLGLDCVELRNHNLDMPGQQFWPGIGWRGITRQFSGSYRGHGAPSAVWPIIDGS